MNHVRFKLLKDFPFYIEGEVIAILPRGSFVILQLEDPAVEILRSRRDDVKVMEIY